MNNKGGTFGIWIEIIVFIAMFIAVLTIMNADMNAKYSQSKDLTLGLNLSEQVTSLENYQSTIVNQSSSGGGITDFGIIKLTTLPSILYSGISLIWTFVSGEFIFKLVSGMQLGVYGTPIAVFFQILYVIAIGFIFLKLILKVEI